ncbi:BTAD domain-containing putative transcriptional regulator [Kitasatospora sp. NPDC059673]|uniref:AfsR/SARP family transcriptional regulator n=1 Tax=Kitasatospora sp. NPDC059673 TaxID=3346901 RepID=UPI0036B4E9B1
MSARKVEILFAALLARAGQSVGINELITELWGESPPARATAALYVYVSQLRKFLIEAGCTGSRIETQHSGYTLHLGPHELDVEVFLWLVRNGRKLVDRNEHERAVAEFKRALGLWHGPALGNLRDGPIVNGFATWVQEHRLECIEIMMESNLVLGRHREIIGQLYSLTVDQPFREAFYRQLMLALYRSERRADALRVYRTARETLRRDLGIDPGTALRNLHQEILTADDRSVVVG